MLSRRSPSGLAIFGMTCLVVAAGFSRVFGDVVTLNNGDQVTGTIATYDGTNLTINSVPLGSVNVALKDVKTFSTDGPIKIVLQDGTVLNEKIAAGPAGEITLVPGGPLAQQNIPLTQVTKINPPPVMWTGAIVVNGLWALGNTNSTQLGINLDLGHYTAGTNESPIPFLKKNHARITSMHMKDRKYEKNGGDNLPWGQGDTPIREALQLMKKEKYKFPATIELEYKIPEGSTVMAEMAKCVQYCKDSLA